MVVGADRRLIAGMAGGGQFQGQLHSSHFSYNRCGECRGAKVTPVEDGRFGRVTAPLS